MREIGSALLQQREDIPADRSVSDAARHEEERLRSAYARRSASVHDSWLHPGYVFMQQERERHMLALLMRHGATPLAGKRLLEIGCGAGNILRDFIKWGARPEDVYGLDLLPERIDRARQLCPSATQLWVGDASALDLSPASFDLVVQSTVFTSILDRALRQRVAAEMLRVLAPEGLIVWYDFRVDNPRNRDVRGAGRREIEELFPNCDVELERVTLAPPLARWLALRAPALCSVFAKVPFLRTHYLGAIRRR